ncbi:MAG: hypothetical protein ABFD85_02435 [Phycisphaerae bacterium]
MAAILITAKGAAPAELAEGLSLAHRADKIESGNPHILYTLAAAHAANGHFSEAANIASQAIPLALKIGNNALAAELSARTKQYQTRADQRP